MKRNITVIAVSLVAFFSLIACDGGEDADLMSGHVPSDIPEEAGAEAAAGSAGSDSGTHCAPVGSTLECDDECKGGVQECLKGNILGPCDCPDGGSAGSSGSGGSAGSSGSGGSAGEAGSGGTGGSSGQAGSGGSAGSSGSGGSAGSPPLSVECDQYGEVGEVIVYLKAPLPADHALLLAGWINFPNWMGSNADTAWSLWCFGENQDNTLLCKPILNDGTDAEIVSGTVLEMAPGNHAYTSSEPSLQQASYYCEENDCPTGTFVVCKGKDEVCGSRNGDLTGNMEYVDAPWVNLSCHVE